MDFIKDNWGMLVSFAGLAVMWGTFQTKIKQHDSEIKEIKRKQDTTDDSLTKIGNQLTDLNTKMDLIINGNLKTKEL